MKKLIPGALVQIRTIPKRGKKIFESNGFLETTVSEEKGFTLKTYKKEILFPQVIEIKEMNAETFTVRCETGEYTIHLLAEAEKAA